MTPLDVVQKLVIHLLVNQSTDGKHRQGIPQCQKVILHRRQTGCATANTDDHVAEILDIDVNGIQKEHLFPFTKLCGVIKDRRKVHQERQEHTPKILDIAEKDKHSRKNQAHTKVENDQTNNGNDQREEQRRNRDPVNDTEQQENDKSQGKIYFFTNILRFVNLLTRRLFP